MAPVKDGAQAKPEATETSFDIFEYAVGGNSLLKPEQIERIVSPFMGEKKSLRDVEGARVALERAYHEAGYATALVTIPEQRVDSGTIALQVTEVQIARLRVKGSEYHTPSEIKASVPELAEGNVPNFARMQTEINNFNRQSDVKITPILRAGKVPGTIEAQLDVEDQLPLHGSADISNRQTPNTTPMRAEGSIRYDNLWQRGHSIGLTLQSSPQKTDEVRVAAGTYVAPIGDEGDALTAYAVYSRSKIASLANLPGLGALGNSNIFGLRYTMPLGGTAEYSHLFNAGLDYKNLKPSIVTDKGIDTSPITYTPLTAGYTVNWLDKAHPTTFDISATMGMRGLLRNRESEFDAKGASANFLVMRTGLQRTQDIGRWSLIGKADVQMSSGPLVSNEQFTAGGAESVRGYLEGEAVGDDAARLSLELRTPRYQIGGKASSWHAIGLAFADGAHVRTALTSTTIRGTGIGMRLDAPHGFLLELDLAHALDAAEVTRAGENAAHARLLWNF